MTNSVFIDSSILVEYIKGTKHKLLDRLINIPSANLYINETVLSEFLFYFLAVNGNASPKTLKSSKKIGGIFRQYSNYHLVQRFLFLSNNDELFNMVPKFMSAYNLLPNDAIILATCKLHNINQLASHDADYSDPCEAEGIELLTES